MADTTSQILIFMWKLSFTIGNKYCILLPLKRQTHFIHFGANVCQVLKFDNHSLTVLFFQVYIVFHEKSC